MLRMDLKVAKIPYKDSAGLYFDFHSLRCELATLADAAGVSPRVVQKLMRHSKLEMTQKYTRPRAVDVRPAAVVKLPACTTRANTSISLRSMTYYPIDGTVIPNLAI